MTKWRVEPKLLEEFLVYVLDAYKDGTLSRSSAVGAIDHLIGGFDLPPDEASNPTNYMKKVIAGELEH